MSNSVKARGSVRPSICHTRDPLLND